MMRAPVTGGVMRRIELAIAVSRAVLAASLLIASTWSTAPASSLQVEYDAPRLSVEAADVGLVELLSAIGAKVGFTVGQSRAPSPPVTLSVSGASVEDVLRRLLRSENHTILYRQGPDAAVLIDRIVLLGPPGEGSPAPTVAARHVPAAIPAAVPPAVRDPAGPAVPSTGTPPPPTASPVAAGPQALPAPSAPG